VIRRCLPGLASILLVAAHSGQVCSAAAAVGRFDSRIQVDNRYLDDELILEQRGEITLNDEPRGVRMGLSFALRQRDESGEVRLDRLFAERRFPSSGARLTVGRTERSDSLGFYTLDGMQLDWSAGRLGLHLYAGVPARIEDYRSIEGEGLYGIELQLRPADPGGFLHRARLGWQHHRDGTGSDRLSGGMTGRTRNRVEYLLSGVYVLQEARLEEASGKIRGEPGKKTGWSISGQIYRPRRPWLTFRERYYALYAAGRQSVVQGSFYFRPRRTAEWSLGGRHVSREQGDSGYGLSGGIRLRGDSGWRRELLFNWLRLGDEVTAGAWFQLEKPLGSRSRMSLCTALQYRDKALYGVDRSSGVELDLERMIRADLYLSLFAAYLWDSRLDDEYRAGARLSWYLDEYRPEKER